VCYLSKSQVHDLNNSTSNGYKNMYNIETTFTVTLHNTLTEGSRPKGQQANIH